MNRPPLKLVFAAVLITISLSLTAQSKLEDLLRERESLLASYEQASPLVQASIKSKLSRLEAEIRAIDPTALDPKKTNPAARPAVAAETSRSEQGSITTQTPPARSPSEQVAANAPQPRQPAGLPVFEYGGPQELAGLRRIYVSTGSELKVRNEILKEIRTELPELIVTNYPYQADIVLVFATASDTYLASVFSTGNSEGRLSGTVDDYGNISARTSTDTQKTSIPIYRRITMGSGLVFRTVSLKPYRVRLLIDFDDVRRSRLERKPSTNFARAFIKAYKSANPK